MLLEARTVSLWVALWISLVFSETEMAQKWEQIWSSTFSRAALATFPCQRGTPVLGTSNGAQRRMDRDTDKKPKNASLECDGNFCIRKMFNVMALYSRYFSYGLL